MASIGDRLDALQAEEGFGPQHLNARQRQELRELMWAGSFEAYLLLRRAAEEFEQPPYPSRALLTEFEVSPRGEALLRTWTYGGPLW